MRLVAFSIALALAASAFGQQKLEVVPRDTGSDLLWKKLESRVEETASRLDGVMGVAILDLTDGRILLRNADRVFPAASSIKIAILLELYRQDQEGRAGAKGKTRLDAGRRQPDHGGSYSWRDAGYQSRLGAIHGCCER